MSTRNRRSRVGAARLALGVLVAVAVTATGCQEAEVPIGSDVRAAVAALQTLPADLYVAHGIAVRECLLADGFEVPFDSSSSITNATRHTIAGVVGVFASEEAARSSGYNTTFVESGSSPLDAFENSLSDAERERFGVALRGDDSDYEEIVLESGVAFGKSKTGCLAEADVAVYGSVRQAMELELFTNDITAQTTTYANDTQSLLAEIVPVYEECMVDAGYEVDGLTAPDIAEQRFGRYREQGAEPSPAEQDMAVEDYRCQAQVELADKLNDLFVSRASVWISKNDQRILQLRESLDSALARAAEVING